MSKSSLVKFLSDLSTSLELQQRLKSDPEGVAKEYSLTSEEAAMVQSDDREGMKSYLGEEAGSAQVKSSFN